MVYSMMILTCRSGGLAAIKITGNPIVATTAWMQEVEQRMEQLPRPPLLQMTGSCAFPCRC
jgi:hypothetical protein